jgi:serine protease Do
MKNCFPILSAAFALALLPAHGQEAAPKAEAPKIEPLPSIKYDPNPLAQGTPSFAPVVEKVAPSVVTISTSRNVRGNAPQFRRFFGIPDSGEEDQPQSRNQNPNRRDRSRRQALGLGSGVVVSPEGHILTNNHVIEGADEILVTIGRANQEYKAKKIGGDPGTDIAVLKIEGKDLPAITFADSDHLRAGDIVVAVGNPFGLTQSATMGVVSAVGRGGMGLVDYENFIQTDASINMGNSGGALVDYQGRLVGINSAIFSRTGGNQGIGFAVPSNLARGVMESILKSGRVVRGFLGVSLQPLNEELSKAFKTDTQSGALVAEVQSGSPAEKAGMQQGDVVTAVNDKKVEGPRELQLMIGALAPGSKVNLKVLRDGQERAVAVDLAERPSSKVASAEPADEDPDVLDGVTVSDIDADARKEMEIPESVKGVVITQIDPDSPSAAAGLRRGDVILEIERKAVSSSKQAVEMSEQLKKEKKVLLRVFSRGTTRYVVVEERK